MATVKNKRGRPAKRAAAQKQAKPNNNRITGRGASIQYRKLRRVGKRLYVVSDLTLCEIATILSVGKKAIEKWSVVDEWRKARKDVVADRAKRYAIEIEDEHEKKLKESLEGIGKGADYVLDYLRAFQAKHPLFAKGRNGVRKPADIPKIEDIERLVRVLERLKEINAQLYGGVHQGKIVDPLEILKGMNDDELRRLAAGEKRSGQPGR